MESSTALAPFATAPDASRGRRYPEPESSTRTVFQRDRDRIIHSTAFRRLQYKTQVFVYHEGDHYRTRLTHSLEVSQIARSICRVLGLDMDLGEALALAHDLGHTPFGHAGEEVLNQALTPYGGFDHNAHTLRIMTKLERRYAEFDGLNLTWETLEGTVKHNGPLLGAEILKPPALAIQEYVAEHDLEIDTYPGPEAQVAALSDDIAYNNHDLDDGVRAGLFTFEEAAEVPLIGDVYREVIGAWPDLETPRLSHEIVRRLINRMVTDLVHESGERIASAAPADVEAVRRLGRSLISFSDAMQDADKVLKDFLMRHMYRHDRVTSMTDQAKHVVSDLFQMYMADPDLLPNEWQGMIENASSTQRARTIGDFIAGMTDRFALGEHDRLRNVDAKQV